MKSKVQYPDLDPNEDLLMVSDNRLINSNERLRVRLTTMQNNVEELEDKLHRFEKQNSLLSEQILKMKLQMDLKKCKLLFIQPFSSSLGYFLMTFFGLRLSWDPGKQR